METIYVASNRFDLNWEIFKSSEMSSAGSAWLDGISYTLGVTAPLIITGPKDVALPWYASSLRLDVEAGGTPLLNYQWQCNGVNLPSQTNSYLSIYPIQGELKNELAGNYRVIVGNEYGSITSGIANVRQDGKAPFFDPAVPNYWVSLGTSGTVNCTRGGSQPFYYQWYRNGSAIPGATNKVLSFINVQPDDLGSYSVVITNMAGRSQGDFSIGELDSTVPTILGHNDFFWYATSDVSWFGQTNITRDEKPTVQSGSVNGSASSDLYATIIGPGMCTFWCKKSGDISKLHLFLNGSFLTNLTDIQEWKHASIKIPQGTNQLCWRFWGYNKTNSIWLSDFEFTPHEFQAQFTRPFLEGGIFRATFRTSQDYPCTIEYKTALYESGWQVLKTYPAQDTTIHFEHPIVGTQRFFRIRLDRP
jgi:hypothetical protein